MKINVKKIKSIKLFGKTYSVKFVDSNDRSMGGDDGRYCGRASHDLQQILIREGMADEQTLDTLLHEIAHIIEVNLGLDLPEKKVTLWATALTDLLLSNDWRA